MLQNSYFVEKEIIESQVPIYIGKSENVVKFLFWGKRQY